MSIQTINGSIISNYPVFEGSQVLTSEQLNGMFDYLDQQNRFTRSRLIGIGIVCGLHIRTLNDQVILSEGIGITSDGFIVKMPECTMSYQRDYFLPSTVAYEAFGSYDSDNIFTQDDDIILYELLHKVPAEGQYQDLTADFFKDKYLLIFLECFDRDPRSCLGKNCEDLGKERIFTTRKLAVDKKGLNKILSKTRGSVENPFFPTSELNRVDLKKPIFDPDGEESKVYEAFVMHYKALLYKSGDPTCVHHLLLGQGEASGLIQATYSEFQPMLEAAYNYQDPFADNAIFKQVKSALRAYLAGGTGDNLKGVQYVYEFYELLINTYHSFLDVGARIAQACCPDKDFSLHIMLGKIAWDDSKEADEFGLLGQSRYRHQFLQPKILNGQSVLRKELISLHRKLVLLVESFQINVIKEKSVSGVDETIKITPIDPKSGAIPRYFTAQQNGSVAGIKTTDLETEWDFDTTVNEKLPARVWSYDRNRITHATLFPVQNDLLGAPLQYRTSDCTYKAEAIFGEELQKVVDGEVSIRDTYHLPFTILPVKIDPNTTQVLVEPRFWQDLQTAYNVTKGEINVTLKNITGHLKDFERAVQDIDFGATTVNVYNFKAQVDQVLTEISAADGLIEQANKLVLELPVRIEAFYSNGAAPSPFQAYGDTYQAFRRDLHKSLLRLRYAREILVREKVEVLEPDLFHNWEYSVQQPMRNSVDFLSNNDFFQLHKLYYSFVARYTFLQENHYSILCNFLRLHPGIDFNAIRSDGTHILIYKETEALTEDGESIKEVFANFTLPYRIDPDQIDIPLDEELEETKLPPLARGESILLEQGQTWLVDSTANDLEPNGDSLRVDSKGVVNDADEFVSGASFNGAKVVSHGGINSVVLRYEPASRFNGTDHFQYTIESESDNSLQDTAYVEVLVVPPYRKHIRAVDDLAATNSHHSVTISILDNDTDYPDTEVILPAKSAFGADLSLSGNQVLYKPVYGREGKDSFTYTLQYEFNTDDGPQTEVSEAQVEVVVFCCNKTDFEIICEGNIGTFQVLTAREREERSTLTLINEDREPVSVIRTSSDHFIEVREQDGIHYLQYKPDVYFKGKETYVYEVTDSEGFMRRVKLEILVMPCTKAYLRRVLCDTTTDLQVLTAGESDLFLYDNRNTQVIDFTTSNGRVKVDGSLLRYQPNDGYVGLDFFEFGFTDDSGVTHYNTMQVIVDGTERVHVESTFQDTPASFNVLSDASLSDGCTLKLYVEKGDFLDEIDTRDGRIITVDGGDIRYTPKTSFIGDDAFCYVVLKDGLPFEYGKFYVIVDTNRKVQVAYTLRDVPKDIQVMTEVQATAGATVAITTPPAITGAEADVIAIVGDTPFIRYTPSERYVGQDSFGYVITVGEVKLYGTVYVIVDSNERIELVNVYKNKPQQFQLFDTRQSVTEFEILEAPQYGSLTQLPNNTLQYIPVDDYTGTDKMKYRANVGGSIQYGTVFFVITCECKDIVITGTVSENSPTFPVIENVRVEEIGTGKHVYTGVSGVFSIQAAPNAKLRFTKDTYETLETDVAYRSTLNVQMERKEVTLSGTVTNAETDAPLEGVRVIHESGTTLTDSRGRYSLVAYAGSWVNYMKTGFESQDRTIGVTDSVINIALVPMKVKVAGTVVDVFGRLIRNAFYEISGTSTATNEGAFGFDVSPNTTITFGADGYESEVYVANASRLGLEIVLNRRAVNVRGTVADSSTGEPLGGVNILNDTNAYQTDPEGYFEFEARVGTSLNFTLKGYMGLSVSVPTTSDNLKVDLDPIVTSAEVSVSGTVVEESSGEFRPITSAIYELDGKIYNTSSGGFSFTTAVGESVVFSAADFQSKQLIVPGPLSDAQVVLAPSVKEPLVNTGPVRVVGTVFENVGTERVPITGARLDINGKTFSTDNGNFDVEVATGTVINFLADGYNSSDHQVTQSMKQLDIVLTKEGQGDPKFRGRVLTGTTPLPGVKIINTRTRQRATSDGLGLFEIGVQVGDVLGLSQTGFEPVTYPVDTLTKNVVDIIIRPSDPDLIIESPEKFKV